MKTTTRKRRYSRREIILAHIIKHLITTVPMTIGFLAALGSAGSYELDRIGTTQMITQCVLGFGLMGLGAVIYNYFEN